MQLTPSTICGHACISRWLHSHSQPPATVHSWHGCVVTCSDVPVPFCRDCFVRRSVGNKACSAIPSLVVGSQDFPTKDQLAIPQLRRFAVFGKATNRDTLTVLNSLNKENVNRKCTAMHCILSNNLCTHQPACNIIQSTARNSLGKSNASWTKSNIEASWSSPCT